MFAAVLVLSSWVAVLQEVPYKPDHEYVLRLDLQFKVRPPRSSNTVDLNETREEYERRTNHSQLPYLTLYLSVKELNNESRIRIERDGKLFLNFRKVPIGKEMKIEVGFTDDAKDKISGYEHIVYFLSDDKKEISRIVVTIEENGDYYINGQKRGRF